MKNWEKPNWFITLLADDKQKNYVNIANVSDISFGQEETKMKWDRKLLKKVEIDPEDFSVEKLQTLEGLGEITTETRHYLYITTSSKTYKCQIRKEEVDRYSDWLRHNNMMELYLNPIICKSIETE